MHKAEDSCIIQVDVGCYDDEIVALGCVIKDSAKRCCCQRVK